MNSSKIIISAFSLAIALSGNAMAATTESNPCTSLIKECFAYSSLERVTCFSSAGSHPFCAGNPVSDLAMERAAIMPSAPEGASAFLGDGGINAKCVENFDSLFSAALVEGSIDEAQITQLSNLLKSCKKVSLDQVVRP